MKNRRIELIKKLSNADGAPGFESDVCAVIRDSVSDIYETFEDNIRNFYIYPRGAVLNGSKPAKPAKIRLALDAHSDECSYIVAAIKNSGLIKFLPLGGMLPSSAIAQRVRIKNNSGEYVYGVVTSTPVHFLSDAQKNKNLGWDDLYIDLGASSKQEVQDVFGVEVGMPVIPDVECKFTEKNETFIGKAFDNRIGTATVIEVMRELKDFEDIEIIGMISSQEEIGARGAKVSVNRVRPDLAIVFEGTPADDSFAPSDEAQSCMFQGTQIRHIDRSTVSHPAFTKFAADYARENGHKLQRAVRSGGGTNAQVIHTSGLGVPTIVLASPVRYVHTHHSITALSDFEEGVKYVAGMIKALAAEIKAGNIDPATF